LKEFLGGRRFKSDEEVKDAVKEWLNGLAAEVYDEGIQKFVIRYDKCQNVGGDFSIFFFCFQPMCRVRSDAPN
jgi:hypothetical protein